jgi:AAA+ ATPase superfamily predicted ATPase
MQRPLIGREKETEILNGALISEESQMIAIIGRRRVGKTYLIQSTYAKKIDFEITGIQHANLKEQLSNFTHQLASKDKLKNQLKSPTDWLAAFQQLIFYLKQKRVKRKKIVFIDELPWIASRKSGFMKALGYFWNSWAIQNNVVVVICGSAASWMIQNIVHNKGGLHNRITKRIYLQPFNLQETRDFLKSKKINLDHYQLTQLYMAMGGIPHYLNEVKQGRSAVQNIDDICFSPNGLLRDEFHQLYPALFESSEKHILVIRALSKKWKGMTRQEIIDTSKLPTGGGTTRIIEELLTSGFISAYQPFQNKKKNTLYRLTDEYSLFYIHFIENKTIHEKGAWKQLSQSQKYKSWCGYAFESMSLQISGVYSESSGFIYGGSKDNSGIQIDLLIDRNDHVINICELKFYNTPFSITKTYTNNLRNKLRIFKEVTKTRKQLMLTFVSSFGINENEQSIGLVDNSLTMEILFEK